MAERFTVVPVELPLHRVEAPIDPVEPGGDGLEALSEELDEVLILRGDMAPCLLQREGGFKCLPAETRMVYHPLCQGEAR